MDPVAVPGLSPARWGIVLPPLGDEAAPDRIEAAAEEGVDDVTIVASWARLQPGQGTLDGGQMELVRHTMSAARAAGLVPWLRLLGRAPGWFLDEHGFTDAKASGRHWPRFVEAVADAVGDEVGGWFPMHHPERFVASADPSRREDERTNIVQAWRDARTALAGPAPVATSFDIDGSEILASLYEGVMDCDIVGVTFDWASEVNREADRLAAMLRTVVQDGPERPVAVSSLRRPPGSEAEVDEAAAVVVAEARADGVDLLVWFSESGT